MEASEFTQQADPFGDDGGMSEFNEAPPIVNREGEQVSSQIEGQTDIEQALAAESPDPQSAPTDGETTVGATGATEPDPTASPTTREDSGESQTGEPSAESGPGTEPADPAAAASQAVNGEAQASAPKAKKGDTRRPYLLFVVDGPGKFAEVSWHENKKGEMVPKGTPGSKRQTTVLARGQDDALAVGFAALDSPAEEVALVAVAASYFRIRRVAADPIPPIRQRLKII